jgi:phosphohistidine phosphatase
MKQTMLPRELLILRHGKSDWSIPCSDLNRPLNKRGKRAVQKMGAWLQHQNLIPDWILSSPAERALVTTEKLCTVMGLDTQIIHIEKKLYESHLEQLKKILRDCPDAAGRVLLVGHNPGLEYLLEYLAGQDIEIPDDGKLLPTATLARLFMPDKWESLPFGCAKTQSIIRPSTLP